MDTMQVKIIRIESGPEGTFGVLLIDNKFFCLTLERPWENNKREVSCIPTGVYDCQKIDSPHFGLCYEIMNVKDRTEILIHNGSFVNDTKGCVLIGRSILSLEFTHGGPLIRGIGDSKETLKLFNQRANIKFKLEIVNAF